MNFVVQNKTGVSKHFLIYFFFSFLLFSFSNMVFGVSTTKALSPASFSFGGGNQTISGSLTVKGNTILGDSLTDTITANALFNSFLIPSVTNTYDLGSSALYWNNLYAKTLNISGDLTASGSLNAKTGRTATIVVAASNATAAEKAQADYVCSGTTSCLTELNAAVTALPALGGSIQLSSGIFYLADGETWTITKNVVIRGSGKGYYYPSGEGTTIYKVGTGDAIVFLGNHDITVTVRDLNIQKKDDTDWTSGDGIKLSKVNEFLLDNVQVDSAGSIGINVLASWSGVIQNSIIRHSGSYGIKYGKVGDEVSTAQRVENSHVGGNTTYDIYIDSALDVAISKSYFEQYSSTENFIYIGGASSSAVVVDSSYFSSSYSGTTAVYAYNGNVKFLNNTIGGDHNYGYDGVYGIHTIIGNHFLSVSRNSAIRINDWLTSAIVANNYFIVGVNYAMLLYGPTASINITGNVIEKRGGSGLLNAIQSNGVGVISSNTLYSDVTGAYGTLGIAAPSATIRNNVGYVTENSGTATVANSSTSIVVNHGLATTPTRVFVTPTNSMGNSTKFYVDSLTPTQFTIHTDLDPGETTAIFNWRAVVGEGN